MPPHRTVQPGCLFPAGHGYTMTDNPRESLKARWAPANQGKRCRWQPEVSFGKCGLLIGERLPRRVRVALQSRQAAVDLAAGTMWRYCWW